MEITEYQPLCIALFEDVYLIAKEHLISFIYIPC